jgi:intracellular septation protein A
MHDFLMLHADTILLIVAFIALLILYRQTQLPWVKEMLFKFVTEAESKYGSKTGVLKFAAVVEWIYAAIPLPLQCLITKKRLDRLIENALTYAKEVWKTNGYVANLINGDTAM